MIFSVEEMVAPGSGVARLEKVVEALGARVAELEKKLAANVSPITFLACPKCGRDTQHKPTGKILTSMPPQTEIACVGCGLTRGVQ
jgi:hypothetical protein